MNTVIDPLLKARVAQAVARPLYRDPMERMAFRAHVWDVKNGRYGELNQQVIDIAKQGLDDEIVDAVQMHLGNSLSRPSDRLLNGLEVTVIDFKPWNSMGCISKDTDTDRLTSTNPLVQSLIDYVYSKGLDPTVKENTIYDSDDFSFMVARIPPDWFNQDPNEALRELEGKSEEEKAAVVRVLENKALLTKYNIDPRNITVVSQSSYLTNDNLNEITDKKELFLVKLLKAHEHALKNRRLGTSLFSNRQYSTSMQLELTQGDRSNTFWVLGGNFEMNISELICGERGCMTIAVNEAVDRLEKEFVDNLPETANIGDMLRVKRLVMTSSKELGEDKSAWQPCSDCYGWMGTERFFNLDTQILSLGKDAEGKFTLEVRTLRDLLTMQGKQVVSFTNDHLESLPIEYSQSAKEIAEASKLSENIIRKLLVRAKDEYESAQKINEGFSGKEAASSVLFHESRKIFTGRRVEWVPRWTEPADLIATTIGINELTKKGIKNPTVKAIAHIGDYDDIPSIKSNGRLAQKRGGKDVIHIVIENNIIKVRTIKDYQPFVHGSVRTLSTNRTTV